MSAEPPSLHSSSPSLMRLAVVERQLIMQGLDLTSVARLASTCSQLRAEAMHREAGKFIPEPRYPSPLRLACSVSKAHPAHASPLFRAHAPMKLWFQSDLITGAAFEALKAKAATFSRITHLRSDSVPWWTADRALRLLALPSMQTLKTVQLFSPNWLNSPRVQTALLSLPQLQECEISLNPIPQLLPSAITASHVRSVRIEIWSDYAASVRSLRVLRLAPALTSLTLNFRNFKQKPQLEPVPEIVWCLPPTLTDLNLWTIDFPRDTPRPLLKALLSHTPLLQTLRLRGSIEAILRGLLDAGLRALPLLHRVAFAEVSPDHCSYFDDPDPIRPLLRRFLHRFPQVTVQLSLEEEEWEDVEQMFAMEARYRGWPRVDLGEEEGDDESEGSPRPRGRPPSPHASDDEDGSDVEELQDPGLDERGH